MAIKTAVKVYINKDGKESRHATPDAVALVFRFTNGHEVTVDPTKLPADIATCLQFHGASQKIGDSYASAETLDEAIENAEGTLENLMEGIWVEKAEGMVRTSVLAEALARCKPDKYHSTAEAQVAVKSWDKEKRKNVLDATKGVPALIAAYESIRAERAMQRADAASQVAARLKDGDESLNDL